MNELLSDLFSGVGKRPNPTILRKVKGIYFASKAQTPRQPSAVLYRRGLTWYLDHEGDTYKCAHELAGLKLLNAKTGLELTDEQLSDLQKTVS